MSDLTSKIPLSTFSLREGKDEGPMLAEKQGIVSILHADGKNAKPPMRRTLSADMSSKKWLQQNGLSPMKKLLSSSDEQAENSDGSPFAQAKDMENRTSLDIWSSIISKKTQDEGSHLPPPYVHPLVKRSKSSLSVKSLEICTESLGSETGFDGLAPVLPLEVEVVDKLEKHEERSVGNQLEREGSQGFRTNTNTTKTTPRSFPPPLPSLARRDGPYLQMHSHREDGRVVLEAVSVPQQNCFQAHREDGRLLLKLIDNPDEAEEAEEAKNGNNVLDEYLDEEKTFADIEKNEDDKAEDEEVDGKINKVVFSVQRPVVKMSRIMEMEYMKRKSFHQFINKPVELVGVEEEEPPKYLPPPNHELVNTYDYVWRAKPAMASIVADQKLSPPLTNSNNTKNREHKELVLFRGNKEDCLVPFMKVCKDSRRPIVNMEAYCIPTS